MPIATQRRDAEQKAQPWKAVQAMRAGAEKKDKVEQVGQLGSIRLESSLCAKGGSLGG